MSFGQYLIAFAFGWVSCVVMYWPAMVEHEDYKSAKTECENNLPRNVECTWQPPIEGEDNE